MVLSGPARMVIGTLGTRVRLTRAGEKPAVEEVSLLKFGDGPGTVPVKQVDQRKIIPIDRVTIRIVVPSQYRQCYVNSPGQERVTQIISELAQQASVRAHLLTGGKWHWEKWSQGAQQETWHLTGYVRTSKPDAEALVRLSGKRGIFINCQMETIAGNTPPQFHWFKREKEETDEQYYRRAVELAQKRDQPLCLRKGLGSDLGVARKEQDPIPSKFRHLEIAGVPRSWRGRKN